MRVRVLCALLALVVWGATATTAPAADPGRWVETGYSPVPFEYFQGVTSDRHKNLWFDGFFSGLYRTDPELNEQARNFNAIPFAVSQEEGYNHIGDISWDRHEHGRILLPLECYFPIIGNFCGTGAIGVADPETLAVALLREARSGLHQQGDVDRGVAERQAAVDLQRVSGDDLLAYDMDDITAANAAPGGTLPKPVRILDGAVPPIGITGATFDKHRLLVAGAARRACSRSGRSTSRTVRESSRSRRPMFGESEGLDIVKSLGGELHWLITPLLAGGRPPTYGQTSALVHFERAKGRFKP